MEVNKNCFEVSPSFLKGQIKTFNPFERIFKNFLFSEVINPFPDEVKYNEENYDKMVENYYIYKNQFKKYGLTFNVNEEYGENGEERSYLIKIFFLPENYRKEYTINEGKILYKGKDYYLINTNKIYKTYKEKDNKAYFELVFFINYDNPKKFELQIITLDEQYQQNIKPGESDLLYFDTKKIGKKFKSLQKEYTKRELINYGRIKEIPYLFNFTKSMFKHPEPKPDLNDYVTFNDYWEKLLENAPLYSTDKNDFIKMLNIMYEDQYLSHFKEKYNYSERDDYAETEDKYLKEFGSNGDLNAEDVEKLKREQNYEIYVVKDNSLKEIFMSEEYPFIKRKKVIYELCERKKKHFYRRYLIYDPLNNFCSFYISKDIFDNYIYGLKKDQGKII